MRRLKQLARTAQDRGASAVEYGLMVAAISAILVGVVFGMGALVRQSFTKTCSAIQSGAGLEAGSPDCDGQVQPPPTDPPADPVAP